MPEVSIIIPVFNNGKFIEKCIYSVTGQTFEDLEILVIDDGSTDGSGRILDRIAAEDRRIRLVHQENQGVAAARNRGLDMASGRYLTFVDGDDYIGPDYIERLYAYMTVHSLELLICGLVYVDEDGRELSRVVPGVYRRFEREEWAFRISAVCSHFYLRELWERHGMRFCPGERGEDMPISMFFAAVCDKIGTIPTASYYYVQHSDSAVHNFRGLGNFSLPYRALEENIKKVRQAGLANSAEFHELFVMRILATCFFELAPGASREKMRELCDYIVRILNTWFPRYAKNKMARLTAPVEIPFSQKAAVKLLGFLVKTRLIYPASAWLSRRTCLL